MAARSGGTEAGFVFRGTVKKTKAATMREVPVSDQTVVVRVDEVLQAPQALAHYAGQDITVELGGRGKVRVGQQAVFRTNGWLFGKSLAVRSVGRPTIAKRARPTAAKGAKAISGRPSDAVRQSHLQEVKSRVKDADLVIHGRVAQVRLPADSATGRARAGGGTASAPISEHDPLWREAVIEVQKVHKGRKTNKEIVVRFPSSTDVRWHRAPKFHAGQEGLFILRRHPESEAAVKSVALRAPGVAPAGAYTALSPEDFQPATNTEAVQTAIQAAT